MKLALHFIRFVLVCVAFWPLRAIGAEGNTFRVAVFYNASIFKDTTLIDKTAAIFDEQSGLKAEPFPYMDSNEFVEKCRALLASDQPVQLILGPSDSKSLRSLDDGLSQKQTIPFLAPFITTEPSDYKSIQLISGSPTDQTRIQAAMQGFVRHAAQRAFACIHTDDAWGQGVAKHFRGLLTQTEVTMITQPVIEMEVDSATGSRQRKNNSDTFLAFLKKAHKQGVSVISVALIDSQSVNDLLESLKQMNRDSWVKYLPTIVLMNPPSFTDGQGGKGINSNYAAEFRLVFVRDEIVDETVAAADRGLLPHIDACRVIAEAYRLSGSTDGASRNAKCLQKIKDFYSELWTDESAQIQERLKTGFHRSKVAHSVPAVEVVEARLRQGKVVGVSVDHYFNAGYWKQFLWKLYFFFSHNRSLWNPALAPAFLAVCFASFLHMIRNAAMKNIWLIVWTWAFWGLLLLNVVLTYSCWALSVRYGLIEDDAWAPALLLATLCPSAATALADLMRRFLPMFNLNGVVNIVNEITAKTLREIGDDELRRYRDWLANFASEKLRRKLFEVLLLEVQSDSLRNRVREELNKDLKSVTDGDLHEEEETALRKVYAQYLVRVVAYISANKHDLHRRVVGLFVIQEGETAYEHKKNLAEQQSSDAAPIGVSEPAT